MQGDRQFEIARMRENFIVETSTKRVILHYCIFIIMFSESISIFPEPLFRISVYEIPICFALLDEAKRFECALNTYVSIPTLGIVFLIHRDIVSSDAAFCSFP